MVWKGLILLILSLRWLMFSAKCKKQEQQNVSRQTWGESSNLCARVHQCDFYPNQFSPYYKINTGVRLWTKLLLLWVELAVEVFPPYFIEQSVCFCQISINQSQTLFYYIVLFVLLFSSSLTSTVERPTQWRTPLTSWCRSTPPEWSCGTSRRPPGGSWSWIPSANRSSTIMARGGRPTAAAPMTYLTSTSCNRTGTEHFKFGVYSRPDHARHLLRYRPTKCRSEIRSALPSFAGVETTAGSGTAITLYLLILFLQL